MFSLYLYLYLELFALPILNFLAYNCLHLLINTFVLCLRMFLLYCYVNLIKLLKYGEYRNYDKTFLIEEYF